MHVVGHAFFIYIFKDGRPNEDEPLVVGKYSYSLGEIDGTWSRIAVWLDQDSFYITNLDRLPEGLGLPKKLNKQGCLQLSYKGVGGMITEQSLETAWPIAQAVVANQKVIDAQLRMDADAAEASSDGAAKGAADGATGSSEPAPLEHGENVD